MSPTSYQTAPPRIRNRCTLYTTPAELTNGAEGRTRTGTSIAHHPLKMACLPISPLRLKLLHLTCALTLLPEYRIQRHDLKSLPAQAGHAELPLQIQSTLRQEYQRH